MESLCHGLCHLHSLHHWHCPSDRNHKVKDMKKNMGTIDRIVRLLIVVVAVTLYFTGVVTGLIGTIALVLAVIFTLTSTTAFCPIYAILGLKTCKVNVS